MNLQELREKKDALLKKAKALVETDGELTDEQEKEFAQIETDTKKVNKAIDRMVAVLEMSKGTEPKGSYASFEGEGRISDVHPSDATDSKPYAFVGRQLMDVAFAAKNKNKGGREFENVMTRLTAVQGSTNATTGSASDGGFLIQNDFSTNLLKLAEDQTQLRKACTPITISRGNGIDFPLIDDYDRTTGNRFGGVRVYWAKEAGTVDLSKLQFSAESIKLNKLMAFCKTTEELLEDAAAIESWINLAYPREQAFVLDDAIMRGDGVGKCLGVLNANCTATVAKTTSQSADTITYANVSNMKLRMAPELFSKAVWYVNNECTQQLEQMYFSGTNSDRFVYMPAGGISGSPYGTLWGRPVIPIEQCSALGDLGDILLADMSQYLIVNKGGMRADRSIEVEFLTDQSVFRFITRINGRPLWKTVRTPAYGSTTVAPFVTLAARA